MEAGVEHGNFVRDSVVTADDTLTALTGTFVVNKKANEVVAEGKIIKWRRADKPTAEYQSVCFDAVFAVISGGAETETDADPSGKNIAPHFTLHYINKTPKYLWKPETVTFNAPETKALDVTPWVARIKEYITNPELRRPKRLLVFVNPRSGGCKGVQIYDAKAAPLLKLSGVETDVIVTENGEHAGDVLSKYDLDRIDGVVTVGGDGSFQICLDALLRRCSRDAGIDVTDATTTPVRPPIPAGIIPAGTGQGMSMGLTQTTDPVTATLHIIMGERHVLHALSAYNGERLLGFGVMQSAYGLFGDAMKIGENTRHFGRLARYLYAIAKALAAKRTFDAEIHYKPVPEMSVSGSGDEATNAVPESDWEVVKGSFCSIHMFMMDLTLMRWEQKVKEGGFVPKDQNIQTMYLYWATQECSRMKFVKSFISVMTGEVSSLDDHYISLRPVKEYKIVLDIPELNENTSCLTIDGELNTLLDKTVHIKCHQNLLPVFGAGAFKIFGLDKLLEAAKKSEK